jgi:hypothetical protein
VTRCYPGRAASGRGDRTPTPREQELCRFWRDWELELLRPDLIVTVGGLALRQLLGVKALTDAIGKSYEAAGAIVIPLPHPSGASGWLNDVTNRARLGKALTHVRRELARLESRLRCASSSRSPVAAVSSSHELAALPGPASAVTLLERLVNARRPSGRLTER